MKHKMLLTDAVDILHRHLVCEGKIRHCAGPCESCKYNVAIPQRNKAIKRLLEYVEEKENETCTDCMYAKRYLIERMGEVNVKN